MVELKLLPGSNQYFDTHDSKGDQHIYNKVAENMCQINALAYACWELLF